MIESEQRHLVVLRLQSCKQLSNSGEKIAFCVQICAKYVRQALRSRF